MSTTTDLIAKLEQLGDEFLAQAQSLADEQAIRAVQAQFLGKKGKVSDLMKELGKLPTGDRSDTLTAIRALTGRVTEVR